MANVKQVMIPSVEDFIERFAEKTWAVAVSEDPANPYWDIATRYFAGFSVAFEVIFGREATKHELDTLQLNLMEREHQHLIERGSDASGFTYPSWYPGSIDLLKVRARLGKPGGAKNAKEYNEVVDAARRDAARRRCAA
jgi:hypothetical protein